MEGSVAVTSTVSKGHIAAAVVASVIGWSLDMFDLFILLYVAPTIGGLFFPTKFPTLTLAAAFAAYAVSALMRPFGGAFFGSLADKRGRRIAMIIAVGGVGLFTASLGALPTFEVIGIWAPILFMFLRLVQGTFMGGVTASTHTITTETVAPKWRGLMSGLISGGASIGAFFASFVLWANTRMFPGPAFIVWGWRFMFFSALLTTVFAFIMYRLLEESPLWVKEHGETSGKGREVQESPLRTLFSHKYSRIMWLNIFIVTGAAVQYYLTAGFLPSFLTLINKVTDANVAVILMQISLISIISPVLVGQLSEYIGRRKTFLISVVVNLIVITFAYVQLSKITYSGSGLIMVYALVIAFLGNAAYAPILIFLNERFPTAVRASGTAICWNVGFAIGGLMPAIVAAVSPTLKDLPLTIIIFIVVAIAVMFIGSILSPETKGQLY
jgi:MFS family permease